MFLIHFIFDFLVNHQKNSREKRGIQQSRLRLPDALENTNVNEFIKTKSWIFLKNTLWRCWRYINDSKKQSKNTCWLKEIYEWIYYLWIIKKLLFECFNWWFMLEPVISFLWNNLNIISVIQKTSLEIKHLKS